MTREAFLSQLRLTLQGKVSSDKVQENMKYYNDYIIDEVRKGKKEEDVLDMLGDPALLAKSIIAADNAEKHSQDTVYDSEDGVTYSSKRTENSGSSFFGHSGGGKFHLLNLNIWWQKLLFVLVIVMVVLLIVSIVTGLVRLFAPIVAPVIVIILVVRVFGRRK